MAAASNDIVKLSGSIGGQPILIASTGPVGTAGTHIMLVPVDKTGRLELWAWSNSSVPVLLTLQLGDPAASKELSVWIPPKGSDPKLVVPFWPYEAGMAITAYASVANMVCVDGHFNECTPAS